MPATKAKPRIAKVVKPSRSSRRRTSKFTFEEVEDGIEISSESGVIMVCKVGEGVTAVPAGSASLMQMLGGDEVALLGSFPVDSLWLNLASARHSPEYVYWLHPVDYDAAVLMFKKIGNPDRAA